MKKIKENKKPEKNLAILKFLKKTKDGKYGEVEKSSLKFSRVRETSEVLTDRELYYYSLG